MLKPRIGSKYRTKGGLTVEVIDTMGVWYRARICNLGAKFLLDKEGRHQWGDDQFDLDLELGEVSTPNSDVMQQALQDVESLVKTAYLSTLSNYKVKQVSVDVSPSAMDDIHLWVTAHILKINRDILKHTFYIDPYQTKDGISSQARYYAEMAKDAYQL